MIKTHRTVACAMALLAICTAAKAGEIAGMVKTSRGEVNIERAGQRLGGAVGTSVQISDKVRTGENGSVGVTLRDNTLLSAGPNSVITIDRFAYDSTTQTGGMSVGIRKGTLSVASGKIAKKTPESVDFHTPTSVLGVRGTEFVIEVKDGSDE